MRKNVARLIEAFARVAQQDVTRHLVVVGEKDGKYSPGAIPDHVTSRIHFLGHVTDDELRWLYENCDLFVFPSLDEGYGEHAGCCRDSERHSGVQRTPGGR